MGMASTLGGRAMGCWRAKRWYAGNGDGEGDGDGGGLLGAEGREVSLDLFLEKVQVANCFRSGVGRAGFPRDLMYVQMT